MPEILYENGAHPKEGLDVASIGADQRRRPAVAVSQAAEPSAAAPVALKGCFEDPLLEVMNFLNEVVLRYPSAVSFAPGRPSERHFDVAGSVERIALYVAHRAAAAGIPQRAVYDDLGQYNRTNGIVGDLIAAQIAADLGVRASAESIIVTAGCQEGMAILLAGLFDPAVDVLLASDPTYIGITGLARVLGITVTAVPGTEQGMTPAAAAAAMDAVTQRGLRPRALYDIPDFNNPLGTRMPLAWRRELIDLARQRGVLLFEDDPYGMFDYDGARLPPLKALDPGGQVIYLGSFSKTLFPGLRMGYLVLGQDAKLPSGGASTLAAELSKVKSLLTINTSPLVQALVGGILIENGGSLRGLVERKLPFYRANRDRMLHCLGERLGGLPGVEWNRPQGGFFLTVGLPFAFDDACLESCARDYGVICCPMSYFALTPGRERQVRLSFSYVTPEQIEEGVARFARFVRQRLAAAPDPPATPATPPTPAAPARGLP
jgi:(S)-3,5-dihydroxyphenylglycine transaminase